MSYLTNPYRYSASQKYSTDFSSHGDWSANTSRLEIVTASSQLEWDCREVNDQYMNIDLSSMPVSDTEWLLRYEFLFSSLSANSPCDVNNACFIGLYSNSTPTGSLVPTGDALRYGTQTNNGFANICDSVNEGAQAKTDESTNPFSLSTSTGTTFYVQLNRVSEILLEQKVFSTSDYSTTQVGTTLSRETSSAVNTTNFLTIQLFTTEICGSGYHGTLKSLDFYNDSSVPF